MTVDQGCPKCGPGAKCGPRTHFIRPSASFLNVIINGPPVLSNKNILPEYKAVAQK